MYRRILIVVATRPEARTAVQEGVDLARVHGAEVLLVCVVPQTVAPVVEMTPLMPMAAVDGAELETRRMAEQALEDARAVANRAGVPCQAIATKDGDAVRFIATFAREQRCDLVVATAEPRNALMRLLSGSVVPGLITQVTVPVLVCHEAPPAA